MLKKAISVVVMLTMLVSMSLTQVIVSADTPADNVVLYNRDFTVEGDVESNYIHSETQPDELYGDGVWSISDGVLAGDSVDEEENTPDGGNVDYVAYFNEPYTEESNGVLHISYKMTATESLLGNDIYHFLKCTLTDDSSFDWCMSVRNCMGYGNFSYRTQWHGENPVSLNGTFRDYNGTAFGNPNVQGTGSDNTIEYYFDLKSQTLVLVVNGIIGPAVKVTAYGDVSPNVPISAVNGFTLRLANGEKISYDDLHAEVVSGKTIEDLFTSSILADSKISEGGFENLSFTEASLDGVVTKATDNGKALIGLPLNKFSYKFDVPYTKADDKVLYVKYDMFMDATDKTSDGEWQNRVFFVDGQGNQSYIEQAFQNQFRGSGNWNDWYGQIDVKTVNDITSFANCGVTVEAYIDLSLGLAAMKYDTGKDWDIRALPQTMIDTGIHSMSNRIGLDGAMERENYVFLNNITVKTLNGNMTEQGIDFGVATFPSFYDYENKPLGDTIVNAKIGNDEDNQARKGIMELPFMEKQTTGKIYIGFDIIHTEAWNGEGANRIIFGVKDGNNVDYALANICYWGIGLQEDRGDWQGLSGKVNIERTKGSVSRFDLKIDLDGKTFSGYLNGVLLATNTMDLEDKPDADWKALYENGINGFFIGQEDFEDFAIDNLKLTKLDEGLTAYSSVKGDNTVEVEFGTSLKDTEIAALTEIDNWEDFSVLSVEKVTQSRISLEVASITDDYKTIKLPETVDVSGIYNIPLNVDTIHYSTNSVSVKEVAFTGSDDKLLHTTGTEEGIKNIKLIGLVGTPAEVKLVSGNENIEGTYANGVFTPAEILKAGEYTLKITGDNSKVDEWAFTIESGLSITDLKFVDASDGDVTKADLLAGGDYKVKVTTNNTKAECYLLVATYGENNKLLKLNCKKIETEGQTTDSLDILYPDPAETTTVAGIKAFVLKSLDTIQPVVMVLSTDN